MVRVLVLSLWASVALTSVLQCGDVRLEELFLSAVLHLLPPPVLSPPLLLLLFLWVLLFPSPFWQVVAQSNEPDG